MAEIIVKQTEVRNIEAIQTNKSYQVFTTGQYNDAAWDAFLAETPGGHHVQTRSGNPPVWLSRRIIALLPGRRY